VSATSTVYRGHPVINPAYADYKGQGGASDPHDVSVLVLDTAPTGITPATVAPAGYLDRMALNGAQFLAVGYGTVRVTRRTGPQGIVDNDERRRGSGTFRSLQAAWLRLSANQATGDAGTCFGDSGGPHFLGTTLVAITSIGDSQCKNSDVDYRIDTAETHAFLDPFLTGRAS
jgi:hypothetical protein